MKAILPYKVPFVLGNDLAGVVIEMGSAVTRFTVGEEVFARSDKNRIGTFAELIAVHQDDVAIKPATLTTTSTADVDLVKGLGTDVVVDYKKQAFETVLHDYDVALDSLGGDTLLKSLDVLKPDGKVISAADPPDAALARELGFDPVIRLVMSALTFRIRRAARRRNVTSSFLFMRAGGDQLRELTLLVEAGKARPVVDTVFPFEATREALEYLEAGHATAGKVVGEMA